MRKTSSSPLRRPSGTPSASGYKEGLWLWKRTPRAWDEIKKMEALPDDEKPLSPELIVSLKEKYHYYIIGFALPEDCALLGCVAYVVMTNAPAVVRVGMRVFGLSVFGGFR